MAFPRLAHSATFVERDRNFPTNPPQPLPIPSDDVGFRKLPTTTPSPSYYFPKNPQQRPRNFLTTSPKRPQNLPTTSPQPSNDPTTSPLRLTPKTWRATQPPNVERLSIQPPPLTILQPSQITRNTCPHWPKHFLYHENPLQNTPQTMVKIG